MLHIFAVSTIFSILQKRKLRFVEVNLPVVTKQVSDGYKTHRWGRKNQ